MSVLVANPGALQEMPMAAAGLARANMLAAYVAPVAYEGRLWGQSFLPRQARFRLETELRRRAVPPDLPRERIIRSATLAEGAVVSAQRLRLGPRVVGSLVKLRDRRLNSVVTRLVREWRAQPMVVGGMGLNALRAASELGVPGYVHELTAHHRYAQRVMLEEASLKPDFADTLQLHNIPMRMQEMLDDQIALAHRLLVLSTYQRDTFEAEGVPRKRLIITPLGVNLDLFRPLDVLETKRPLRVLFVGQLTQRKGLSYLLDAFERARIRRAELVLVGLPVGNALSLLRTRDRVAHVPHVPRPLLPQHYNDADIFVLPSLVEGFPQTALEAMACGLPVIVSEATFGADVITDGVDGYIVPIRDTDAICERLVALAGDPHLRHKIGQAAARRARDFSWRRYGDRVAQAVADGA